MDVNNRIFQYPPIMEILLKFVNDKDLRSCSKVCTLWHGLSLTEYKRRRFDEWFFEDFEDSWPFDSQKPDAVLRTSDMGRHETPNAVASTSHQIEAGSSSKKVFKEQRNPMKTIFQKLKGLMKRKKTKKDSGPFYTQETDAVLRISDKGRHGTPNAVASTSHHIDPDLLLQMDFKDSWPFNSQETEAVLLTCDMGSHETPNAVASTSHQIAEGSSSKNLNRVEIEQSFDMEGDTAATDPPPVKLHPFQEKLTSMLVQPNFCLAFVTTDTLKHIDKVFSCSGSTVKPKKILPKQHSGTSGMDDEIITSGLKTIVECSLNPYLPVHCELHCIASPGIIGCHDNLSPVEVEKGFAISGLLLQDFPGVTVHHCPMEDIPRQLRNFDDISLYNFPIKCLLIFASSLPLFWRSLGSTTPPRSQFKVHYSCIPPPPEISQEFVNACVRNSDRKFAVGGMHVEPLSHTDGSCIVFAGENLEAASIVIDKRTTDVAYELALFKKTGLLENQCFAMMFSGVDGGICKYSVPNYESSIFRSLYPNVPLTGVIGNGTIGMHYLPNVDTEDPDQKERSEWFPYKRCVGKYDQRSVTVFVLLSVKTSK